MPKKDVSVVPDFSSTNVEQIWYIYSSQTLYVEYKGSRLYTYKNVTPEQYQALRRAKHKGTWLNTNITPFPKKYPYKEM